MTIETIGPKHYEIVDTPPGIDEPIGPYETKREAREAIGGIKRFCRETDDYDGSETMTEIRFSDDGSISMVWSDGEALRCPTQDDMDSMPVGDDMTDDEIEALVD